MFALPLVYSMPQEKADTTSPVPYSAQARWEKNTMIAWTQESWNSSIPMPPIAAKKPPRRPTSC